MKSAAAKEGASASTKAPKRAQPAPQFLGWQEAWVWLLDWQPLVVLLASLQVVPRAIVAVATGPPELGGQLAAAATAAVVELPGQLAAATSVLAAASAAVELPGQLAAATSALAVASAAVELPGQLAAATPVLAAASAAVELPEQQLQTAAVVVADATHAAMLREVVRQSGAAAAGAGAGLEHVADTAHGHCLPVHG